MGMSHGLLLRLPTGIFVRTVAEDDFPRSVARSRLSGRMQSFEKCDKRGGLCWTQILTVRRHVATTLNHLPNELILREPNSNAVESGAPLSACISQSMTIPALLGLKHERSLSLQCGRAMQKSRRHRVAAPSIHVRTPGHKPGEMSKCPERDRDQ